MFSSPGSGFSVVTEHNKGRLRAVELVHSFPQWFPVQEHRTDAGEQKFFAWQRAETGATLKQTGRRAAAQARVTSSPDKKTVNSWTPPRMGAQRSDYCFKWGRLGVTGGKCLRPTHFTAYGWFSSHLVRWANDLGYFLSLSLWFFLQICLLEPRGSNEMGLFWHLSEVNLRKCA